MKNYETNLDDKSGVRSIDRYVPVKKNAAIGWCEVGDLSKYSKDELLTKIQLADAVVEGAVG